LAWLSDALNTDNSAQAMLIYLTSFKSGFKFSIGQITQGGAEGEVDGKDRNVDLDKGPDGKKPILLILPQF